ncbi:MAG: hypothetical protein KME57_05885 [Scytonema hyalinum WJT4-NPBG1]|jgi:hypothetical protein|nr:hypothetical protein [Scytonema hyalinum WJT4-NPBG1]
MPLYVAQLSVLFLNWQRQGIVNLFKEELRTQNSECNQWGIGTGYSLLTTKFKIWWGLYRPTSHFISTELMLNPDI